MKIFHLTILIFLSSCSQEKKSPVQVNQNKKKEIEIKEEGSPNTEKNELILRLNYLDRVLFEPFTEDSEISQLQTENFEWILFSYSFSTFAYTNIILNDTLYKSRGERTIKHSIEEVLKPHQTIFYNVDTEMLSAKPIPEYSVLYLGHLNLMLGCYRLISSDTSYNDLNRSISKSLISRYKKSSFFNLESYPASIWVSDNTVAVASIKLYAHNEKTSDGELCADWVTFMKKNYLDEEVGLLYSTIHPKSGKAIEEPRGSMIGWSIFFINQFDSTFANTMYENYKNNFSKNYGLLRLFKERHDDASTNLGDIDSGPMLWGISIPANLFALGNAILIGDKETEVKIKRLINIGAETISENNELHYKVKMIDFGISPMAEALVLFSFTMKRWVLEDDLPSEM